MCFVLCGVIKKFLAIIFTIINIAFLICGIAILIAALLAKLKVSRLIPSDIIGVLSSAPIILIVTGTVIIGIAFLGCCGFRRESLICLIPYAACLVVVILVGVTVSIMLGVFYHKFEENLKTVMTEKFDNYKTSIDSKEFWDNMQRNVKCCGLESAQDWKNDVPESCCSKRKSRYTEESKECKANSSKKPYVYATGCVAAINKIILKQWRIIMYATLAVTAFSILALIVACIIICDIKCPNVRTAKD